MTGTDEQSRARFVLAREVAMAHLAEYTLNTGDAGETAEALLAWQMIERDLTLTMAMASVAQSALAAWAEDTGKPLEQVLQQLALRVASKH